MNGINVSTHQNMLATCYFTWTIHPRVLTELAEVITKPLSIIYQQ